MKNAEEYVEQGDRRLILRFASASLAAFLPIGIALSLLISHQLVDQSVRATKTQAGFITNSILRTAINEDALTFLVPMSGPKYTTFRRFVSTHVIRHPVVLVRIWRSDGTVVFSSVPEQIGQRYEALPPDVRLAFGSYRTVNTVGPPDGRQDNPSKTLPPKLLKTSVPVFLSPDSNQGIPVAVAEVYTDYSVVQGQVDRLFRIVVGTLAIGLFALYLLLLPIARRASRRLEGQARRLSGMLQREQRSQEERRRLLERTLRAAEDERTRIAAELHDGPVQRMAQLGYGLERVRLKLAKGEVAGAQEVLQRVQDETFEEVRELRGMMSQLRPPVLDQRGLEEALRDRAAEVERDNGVECVVEARLEQRLDSTLETTLYRVSQEALTNVAKHANASRVELSLDRENGSVALEIRDDGVGFVPGQAGADGLHFGLLAMRERVEMRGGTWKLESQPGEGTRIKAVLPMMEVNA